jgi:hypothetical protein
MSNPAPSSALWFYEPTVIDGTLKYVVFEGVGTDPMAVMNLEHNARRLVDDANRTGYPDLAFLADDERGITSP